MAEHERGCVSIDNNSTHNSSTGGEALFPGSPPENVVTFNVLKHTNKLNALKYPKILNFA